MNSAQSVSNLGEKGFGRAQLSEVLMRILRRTLVILVAPIDECKKEPRVDEDAFGAYFFGVAYR